MKKLLLCLCVLFACLTFLGAFHVVNTAGRASAGFACVPMVLTLGFLSWHRMYPKKDVQEDA